jgi:hypothetical protein
MKYKEIKKIGQGSFGTVSLVEDDNGDRWALKTFTPPNLPGVSREELLARFEREVRYPSFIRCCDTAVTAIGRGDRDTLALPVRRP